MHALLNSIKIYDIFKIWEMTAIWLIYSFKCATFSKVFKHLEKSYLIIMCKNEKLFLNYLRKISANIIMKMELFLIIIFTNTYHIGLYSA